MRVFWLIIGMSSLVLGAVGVILPLLPTVPFILLAAFAFARSSPVFHDWLLDNRFFGPMIRHWRQEGAIRRPAKYAASASMAGVFLLSVFLGVGWAILVLQFVVLTGVAIFIWSRPD